MVHARDPAHLMLEGEEAEPEVQGGRGGVGAVDTYMCGHAGIEAEGRNETHIWKMTNILKQGYMRLKCQVPHRLHAASGCLPHNCCCTTTCLCYMHCMIAGCLRFHSSPSMWSRP